MSEPSQPSAQKHLINLIRGWPAPSLHPTSLLSHSAQVILSDPSTSVPALQYGPDSGYQPLREALASWLTRHYHDADSKYQPDPERICVTGGASQNLANILLSFTDVDVTRAVWMTAPCYHLACSIFEDAGFQGRLKAVPEDEDGIDVDILERKMSALEAEEEKSKPSPFKDPGPNRKHYQHIIYVVTTCANPSGKTLPLHRRESLVKLARRHNALVISDDVYDFLQWPIGNSTSTQGSASTDSFSSLPRLPRLSDVDRSLGHPSTGDARFGYAISNGSFSKVAGPGVRTGWVEATPAFAHGLAQTGATRSGGAPSQFCAAMMSDMVSSGALEKFLKETTRPALQRRHALMMDSIEKYIFPHASIAIQKSSLPDAAIYGGYFVWFTLPEEFSAKQVADAAMQEENLIVAHGNMFEVRGDEESAKFNRQMRLCFSWEDEKDIEEGVRRLGAVLARVKNGESSVTTGTADVNAFK
ncbi:PLP-dependent transferase [Sarocladium strictum]